MALLYLKMRTLMNSHTRTIMNTKCFSLSCMLSVCLSLPLGHLVSSLLLSSDSLTSLGLYSRHTLILVLSSLPDQLTPPQPMQSQSNINIHSQPLQHGVGSNDRQSHWGSAAVRSLSKLSILYLASILPGFVDLSLIPVICPSYPSTLTLPPQSK